MDKDGTRRELVKVILTRQLIPGTRDVMRRQGFEDLCLTGKIEETRARGKNECVFADAFVRLLWVFHW